jgi:hypothetical protein
MEGWLEKYGADGYGTGRQRRYFVLKQDSLTYYKNVPSGKQAPRGAIAIEGAVVHFERQERQESYIMLQGRRDSRIFYLLGSPDYLQSWYDTLLRVLRYSNVASVGFSEGSAPSSGL